MRGRPSDRPDGHQADVRLPFGNGGQDVQRFSVELRGDDRLDEQAWLGEHLGRSRIDRAIQSQHRAEGAQGVARQGAFQALGQRFRLGGTAGVVMLDHHRGRLAEVADHRQRAVEVEQVVIREFFAVELTSGDDACPAGLCRGINGRLLMRVLAVAEHLLPLKAQVQRAGETAFSGYAREEIGNCPIVEGRVGESLAGQFPPQFQRRAAAGLNLGEDSGVLSARRWRWS